MEIASPTLSGTERDPQADSMAWLRRELRLLELRLKREVVLARLRRSPEGRSDEFAGLYIPDEEIDGYMEDGAYDGPAPPDSLAALDAEIEKAAMEAEEAQENPLAYLRGVFDLQAAETRMLLACLAPELDLRFERYFAYLQNDVSRRRPSVQLLGRLFLSEVRDYRELRRIFASEASLAGSRLVEMGKADQAFASREPKVAEAVVGFLLGVEGIDPEAKGLGRWRPARPLPHGPAYFRHHQVILGEWMDLAARDGRLPLAFLSAPAGCAKEDLILALAHGLSARVQEWDADAWLAFPGDAFERLQCLERDLRLHGGFLWVRHAEAFAGMGEAGRIRLRCLMDFLATRPWVNAIITGEKPAAELIAASAGVGLALRDFVLPAPDLGERAGLWQALMEGRGDIPESRRALWDGLAAKFRFGPGQILSAIRNLPDMEPQAGEAWEARLYQACRDASHGGLQGFARKLPIKYRWEDMVLPGDVLAQLREIRDCMQYRRRVYDEWGFEGKLSFGKGLNLLFSGASGTGKTMAAEVLAGDLRLDLYQIDLSQVVSKYVGETEKNLARIFREAQSANAILLFDEADALFGKRSEVKDSHDRYANIEINFLLQRMEEFDGMVILTTNMLRNLDAAFTRRIQYTVEFPVPDDVGRQDLWQKVFPAALPRHPQLDVDFLARRFKITGANIKSVAVNGAFLAAANGGVVGMEHLIRAMKREYRKLGKLPSKGEFGPYYHLVRDDLPPALADEAGDSPPEGEG